MRLTLFLTQMLRILIGTKQKAIWQNVVKLIFLSSPEGLVISPVAEDCYRRWTCEDQMKTAGCCLTVYKS